MSPVPIFYFHVHDAGTICEDDEGRELADIEEARAEAVRGLRDLMAGGMQSGELNLACFVEIEDQSRELVATVRLEDAVRITRDGAESPLGSR